jgi:hypothetical protein
MTYILFFIIGLSGGSAQFATEDLCWRAGERLIKEFGAQPCDPAKITCSLPQGLNVRWFCIQSGFKTQ